MSVQDFDNNEKPQIEHCIVQSRIQLHLLTIKYPRVSKQAKLFDNRVSTKVKHVDTNVYKISEPLWILYRLPS